VKLSKSTIEVINCINRINPGAVFKRGSVIKAKRHKSKAPIIRADIEDVFPRDFAIFDLKKFLLMFSLFKDPELEFGDEYVTFRDETSGKSANIKYAVPAVIDHFDYSIDVKMPSIDAELSISEENFKSIQSACSAFTAPEFAFIGNGKKIVLTTYNTQNKGGDTFAIDIGKTDKKFTIILSAEYLTQFLVREYDVLISFKGILQFNSKNVTYWITASEKSRVN
jgi:hypothetical protein